MRIAVVSDVHGHLVALDAVIEDLARRAPDVIVHGGDLAVIGPRPAEVVDRVLELGWPGVLGNTDEMLWVPGVRDVQMRRAAGSATGWRSCSTRWRRGRSSGSARSAWPGSGASPGTGSTRTSS